MNGKRSSILMTIIILVLLTTACQPAAPQVTAPTAQPQVIVQTAPPQVVVQTVEVEKTVVVQETAAPAPAGKHIKMAVLLGGLINDGGFNTVGYQTILSAQKDLGVDTTYIEAVDPAKAAGVITDYISKGYDLVVGWSGAYQNVIFQLAPQYPNTTFAVDAGYDAVPSCPKNVWLSGNTFEDAFFLAGSLAGLMTKSNVLGYVGGVEIPVYKASAIAFEEGAKLTNPKVKVLSTFTGSFDDPVSAKEASTAQIEQGADIIMGAVDHGIFGVTAAAEAAKNVKVIGMTKDQKSISPDTILTSVIIDYGGAMMDIIKGAMNGKQSTLIPVNLKTGYASLAPYYNAVPDDVAAKVDAIKQQLIDGKIQYTTADKMK